jgi:Bifunctional DNA primase/polymerase, N-terminal/Primase C terminal 2 (PriCT-2)/Family of unknown function (DUF5906)
MTVTKTNLDAALEYAQRGWKVFPLFYVLKDGGCSCRPRPGKPCKRIGKHPMTKNGVQDATLDEAKIRQWWTESPYANIGRATGHGGLIVLDVDDASGKEGSQSLDALTDVHGALPETLVVKTGSGGRHYYFSSIEEIKNSASKVGKHIDIRGHGGYVILPPSNHASGGKYEWVNEGTEIAGMPAWLEQRCGSQKIDISEDTLQPEIAEEAKRIKEEAKLSGDELIKLLDFIPPDCERDAWWRIGAALKKELGDKRGFAAWDAWSRKAPAKYDPKMMPIQWESFIDKGISGGTIHHFAKNLGGFRGFETEAADSPEFTNEWCYVGGIKRFVNTASLIEWDAEQFNAMHAHKFSRGKPADYVLRNVNFKKVTSATYWPNKDVWVDEFGIEKLNYWRPSSVEPKKSDVQPFLDHVDYLYPDKEEAKILMQYLAHQVQRPGEKVHWALLLEGDPGIGKSFFAQVMERVLGEHNVKMVNNDQLNEELKVTDRLDIMNKLKPMITEPWCSIREMYRPPYNQPNRFNFLFFTNHDDALLLDAKDRRYCVLKSTVAAQPPAYYAPLFDWMRRNIEALAWHFLKQVDLGDFPAKAHAPMSEGKRQMILSTMPRLDKFISANVAAGEYPFVWNLQKTKELAEILPKYGFRADASVIADSFKRLGYRHLGKRVNIERKDPDKGWVTEKVNFWAIRDFEFYDAMTPGQLRQVWMDQVTGMNVNVSDDVAKLLMDKHRDQNELRGYAPDNETKKAGPM